MRHRWVTIYPPTDGEELYGGPLVRSVVKIRTWPLWRSVLHAPFERHVPWISMKEGGHEGGRPFSLEAYKKDLNLNHIR